MTTTRTALQEITFDLARSVRVVHANALDEGPSTGSYDHETLFELRQVERMAGEAIVLQVRRARLGGATWETIGDALNITRQAAQQRYGL